MIGQTISHYQILEHLGVALKRAGPGISDRMERPSGFCGTPIHPQPIDDSQ